MKNLLLVGFIMLVSPTCGSETDYSFKKLLLITMGDSLTHGTENAGHSATTQQHSYANILALHYMNQFGNESIIFKLPLLNEQGTGRAFPDEIPTNVGIGSSRVHHLYDTSIEDTARTDDNNLFVQLFMAVLYGTSFPKNATQVDAAIMAANHYQQEMNKEDLTLITLWIGANDIIPCTKGCQETGTQTPPATFQTDYQEVVDQLLAGTNERTVIVLLNNIDVMRLCSNMSKQEVTSTLSQHQLSKLSNLIPDKSYVASTGDDPLMADFVSLLSGQDYDGLSDLLSNPENIIDQTEISNYETYVDQLNTIIEEIADSSDRVFYINMTTPLRALETQPYEFQGQSLSTSWGPSGGFCSMDGLHPSATGYAYIAKLLNDELNKLFGWNTAPLEITNYVDNDPFITDHDQDGFSPAPTYSILTFSDFSFAIDTDDLDPTIHPLNFNNN